MASISYLCRRGARYHYRRRLFLREVVNRPITIPLGTANPVEARRLVARLSVKWDAIAMTMMMTKERVTRGYMTASEAVAVFKRGLDEELGLATAGRFDEIAAVDQRTARVLEAAYRVAARLEPDAEAVSSELVASHTDDFSDADRRAVVLMLKAMSPQRTAGKDAVEALQSIGAPVNAATSRDARIQILLARAEAQARIVFADHPNVVAAGDPVSRLLDDAFVSTMRGSAAHETRPTHAAAVPPALHETPYLSPDSRRFSDIIVPTIAAIQAAGDWNEDMAQRKRVMEGFAWITEPPRVCRRPFGLSYAAMGMSSSMA